MLPALAQPTEPASRAMRVRGCQGMGWGWGWPGPTSEGATHQQVDAARNGQAGGPKDGGQQEAGGHREPGGQRVRGRDTEGHSERGTEPQVWGPRPQSLRTRQTADQGDVHGPGLQSLSTRNTQGTCADQGLFRSWVFSALMWTLVALGHLLGGTSHVWVSWPQPAVTTRHTAQNPPPYQEAQARPPSSAC